MMRELCRFKGYIISAEELRMDSEFVYIMQLTLRPDNGLTEEVTENGDDEKVVGMKKKLQQIDV